MSAMPFAEQHERAKPDRPRSAAYRAAHQLVDGGAVFRDPLASAILGDDARAAVVAPGERHFICTHGSAS
jgi:hypothetical protein